MIDALFKYKMWDFTSGTLIYVNTHIPPHLKRKNPWHAAVHIPGVDMELE